MTEEAVQGKESKELFMGYRYRLDLFLNVQCLDLFCDSYTSMKCNGHGSWYCHCEFVKIVVLWLLVWLLKRVYHLAPFPS